MPTEKLPLPSIDDDLTMAPRKVNLKALRPKASLDDETIAQNSQKMGEEWGASTSIQGSDAAPAAPVQTRAKTVSARIDIPEYLDLALRRDTVEKNVTKSYLVMKGLQAIGYRVAPEDLVEDRRKIRK